MIFEYNCPMCKITEDRIVNSVNKDEQYCKCTGTTKMIRDDKIYSTSFSLKGDWWKNSQSY